MKTAIITGSEGQIGRSFVSKLIELDYKVIGIDIVDQVNDGIIYHRADITKKHEIESVLKQHNENITVLINNAVFFISLKCFVVIMCRASVVDGACIETISER